MCRTYFRDVTAGETEKKSTGKKSGKPQQVTSFAVKTPEKKAGNPNFRLRMRALKGPPLLGHVTEIISGDSRLCMRRTYFW